MKHFNWKIEMLQLLISEKLGNSFFLYSVKKEEFYFDTNWSKICRVLFKDTKNLIKKTTNKQTKNNNQTNKKQKLEKRPYQKKFCMKANELGSKKTR